MLNGRLSSAGLAPSTYALSPMQSGMLYEALLHSERGITHGYNIEQLHVALDAPIDAALLGHAFSHVANHLSALASTFEWEGRERPVQRVHSSVWVPIECAELSGGTAARAHQLEQFLAADRERGFDLRVPPLMRVTVFDPMGPRPELVWTFHHLLLDGRSFPGVLDLVFSAYGSLERGEAPRLPPIRPYADFISWLERRDSERSADFFRRLWEGRSAPTPLPAAEPTQRPLARTGVGRVPFRLPASELDGLLELARDTHTTLATVVQAAWALTLARFSGEDDVVFGGVRACRRSALQGAAEEMFGMFMNTLPVRAKLDAVETVGELLAELRAQSLELRSHEHTALTDVQRFCGLAGGAALFETVLMFENRSLSASLMELDVAWRARTVTLHEQPAPPITVIAVQEAVGLEISLCFDRRRFTDAAIARVGEALCVALAAIARGPGQALRELSVLSCEQHERILFDWNDTTRQFPDALRIHELFERQVARQPDAVALEFEGNVLSYAELDARANRLAHVLRARGAAPGQYIGVCLERGFDLVIALLAVAKSGAAYVPLDPDWPRDRLGFVVRDAAAHCVLTERRHASSFDLPAFVLDGDEAQLIAAESPEPLAPLGDASSTCYAIFTSGSTGAPKGVVLTHRAVVNTLDWVNREFGVGPSDRLLFVTSHCFDLSVYDVFGALGAGASVVIASRALLRNPEALARSIVSQHITIWDSAPPALAQLTAFFPSAPANYPLRLVMLSGDWIPLSLPDAVRSVFLRAEVKSLGGATEAAIWSNFFAVGALDPRWASVPYGRPIQNCRYHVLDQRLLPVPVGVPGDLYIGGTCLAQGYLNRPALTAERFIRDPFSSEPGARLYKTGDLARYFEDGELEFLGRSDFQVKIRGYRVELPEIELALLAIPGVRDAVCTAYFDASAQRSLVAYVVHEANVAITDSQIKSSLRERLPEYMVPPVVIFLDVLPLSSNGKLDRKALPSPARSGSHRAVIAPRTDLEQKICAIWEKVLDRRPIGVRDSFFELGGHSLLAVMVMSELERELGLHIPLSAIVECPTVEALAQRCAGSSAGDATSLLVELRAGGPECFFFVHDGDGEVLLYRELAQHIPAQYAVYGIKPRARCGMPIAHASLRELAACYVAEVRRQQPHGPYSFAGLCAGGVIAFEMAHQLHEAGEVTDLLFLMDAVATTASRRSFLEARRRLKRGYRRMRSALYAASHPALPEEPAVHTAFVDSSEDLLAEPQSRATQVLATCLGSAERVVRYEVEWRARARDLRDRFTLLTSLAENGGEWPSDVPALTAREIYEQLRDRHEPCRTPIRRPVLIKARLGEGADEAAQQLYDCPMLGWEPYIDGPLGLIEAPGGHSSMLQRGSGRFVARRLRQLLGAGEETTSPAPRTEPVSVLVITVSYKTAALVERSLQALEREARANPQISLRAFVIDNASGDAPQLRAAVERRGWSNWVTIAESAYNGGFAYGNNAGFRHAFSGDAAPDYLLMLNPDAEVYPGAISTLTDFLDAHPEAAVAGSQLFFEDGTAWPYAFRFPSVWSEVEEGLSFGPTTWLLRQHTVRRRMGDAPEAVDWLPGASMMVRRTAIDELGGLDERYFLYFEELDFCLKLQRAGWRCWYVPQSRVMHVSGQSSGVTDRTRRAAALPAYWYESRRRFFVKNHGLFQAVCTDAASLVAHSLGRLKRHVAGKSRDNIASWLTDFFEHSILWPSNQDVLPPLEFQIDDLAGESGVRRTAAGSGEGYSAMREHRVDFCM